MKAVKTMIRPEEVEFFLRLHGLWEGVIALPPPPDPPYDIETMEPIHAPPHLGWGNDGEGPPRDEWAEDQPAWQAPELPLDDGRVLVLDGDPLPEDWD